MWIGDTSAQYAKLHNKRYFISNPPDYYIFQYIFSKINRNLQRRSLIKSPVLLVETTSYGDTPEKQISEARGQIPDLLFYWISIYNSVL
jgi:hypothetical protein